MSDYLLKIMLFFVKAETVAIGIWIILVAYRTFSDAKAVKFSIDKDAFYGLTFLAIFATMVYVWIIS